MTRSAVSLHTYVWGLGNPKRALLLHGVSSDGATMWRLATTLAEHGFHVTAPDLRGHGSSPRTETYPLEGFLADVVAMGDDWDLVVGHSLGGVIGAALAANCDIGRLFLIDPAMEIDDREVGMLMSEFLAQITNTPTQERMAAANHKWHDQDVGLKIRALASMSTYTVRAVMQDMKPWDYVGLLERLTTPTTIVVPEDTRGPLFLPAHQARAAVNQAITIHKIPGGGHSLHRDAAEAVIEVLLNP